MPLPPDERPAPPELQSLVAEATGWSPESEPSVLRSERAGQPHLVVVTTRAIQPTDAAASGAVLSSRFWHPRDRRWSENFFESLEHALRLFVEESGWLLRQQQELDGPHAHELIFEARREDFRGPSTEEMLEEIGLTPGDVKQLLDESSAPDAHP
ncbi:MAG: hypothetical protein ABJD11_11245 [Gemmatimonadota bacterium]